MIGPRLGVRGFIRYNYNRVPVPPCIVNADAGYRGHNGVRLYYVRLTKGGQPYLQILINTFRFQSQ